MTLYYSITLYRRFELFYHSAFVDFYKIVEHKYLEMYTKAIFLKKDPKIRTNFRGALKMQLPVSTYYVE